MSADDCGPDDDADDVDVVGNASSGNSTNSVKGFSSNIKKNSFIGPC